MTYKLPKGWKEVKLGDVVDINMGQSPKSQFYNEEGNGVPFLQGNRTFGSIYPYIDKYTTKITKLVEKNDILMSVRAPVGDLNIANRNYCIGRGLCGLRNKYLSDYSYLFYVLKFYIDVLKNKSTGTVFDSINKKSIENLSIIIPNSLKEQKVIANTLSTLDDKIENNNKIAKNLEAQAQAIFKHWFVDFEFPNEQGKPYKSSGGEMVESELGMIPKGWNIVKLKDELEFLRGVEPGSKNYLDKKEDDNLPFYRVGEMMSDTNIYVKHDLLKDRVANKDDILVSFDGTVGRVRIGISGGYSTGIRKIFSKGNYFPQTFIYYLFKSKNIQDIIKQHATGTTILHASKSIDYMYIPYNKNIIKKFDGIFNKVFRKLINIQEENKKLEELRDTLLPKLISGELRIPLD